MIDVLSAYRFIAAITGDRDASLTIQTLDDDASLVAAGKQRKDLTRVILGPLKDNLAELTSLNKRGAGVFLQINAGARGARNVTAVRALFVDNDDPANKLDFSKLPPSITVETSPGKIHAYWLLEPGFPTKDFRAAQKHLIASLGTDAAVNNLDRVMRIPGFFHMKNPEQPKRVILRSCDGSRRFRAPEVLQAYPTPLGVSDPQAGTGEGVIGAAPSPAAAATFRRLQGWLDQQGYRYTISPTDPLAFKGTCPFNATHKDFMIRSINTSGAIWAACFHNTCGGNTNIWEKVKEKIGGWGGPVPGFSLGDHVEFARRLLADVRNGENPLPVYADARLYRYASPTGLWEELSLAQLARIIHAYSGLPRGQGAGVVKLKVSDVNGAITTAQRMADMPHFFAEAPAGLNFTNGFLTVDAGNARLVPHSADHRQTTGFPYPWNPDADAPRWAAFLREVFAADEDAEQKIMLLQEFVGACLIGRATSFQACLLMQGEGNNGKSVALGTIQALFPSRLRSAIKPQLFGDDYRRATLPNVRLNAVSEVPESDILESESFKAIIDGSEIDARSPFKEPFKFKPRAGHIFSCNRLPGTVDFSHGFWRRFKVLTFNRQFTEADQDVGLEGGAYFIANELPGITSWAIKGAVRLLAAGRYTEPPSSEATKAAWRAAADVVVNFIDSDTAPTDTATGSTASELYEAFREWLARNGHKLMSSTSFGRRLKALQVPYTHTEIGVRYGLRVTAQPYITY